MKSNKSSNRRNGMRIMIQGLANLQKSNLNKMVHQDELRAKVCYLDDLHRKKRKYMYISSIFEFNPWLTSCC